MPRTTYYMNAIHRMEDGTLTASGRAVPSSLTWTDFLYTEAKPWLVAMAESLGSPQEIIAAHVHGEAGPSHVFLSKVFQPDEITAICQQAEED